MKTDRLIKIIALYQMASALLCAFYLIMLVFTKETSSLLAWINIIVPSVLAIVSFMNSVNIRASKDSDSLRQGSIINGLIFSIQAFILAVDGFLFQYVQGNSVALLMSSEHMSQIVHLDVNFEPLTLIFNLEFNPSASTLVGVNLLALALACISFWAAGNLRTNYSNR